VAKMATEGETTILEEIFMTLPAKFTKRIAANLKKYQGIVAAIKKRDASESDTVTVITDILQDIFGYDKYADITSEYAINREVLRLGDS
jgi:hypothetical protein